MSKLCKFHLAVTRAKQTERKCHTLFGTNFKAPAKGHCFLLSTRNLARIKIIRNDERNSHSTLYQRVFDWIIADAFLSLLSIPPRCALAPKLERTTFPPEFLFKRSLFFNFTTDKSPPVSLSTSSGGGETKATKSIKHYIAFIVKITRYNILWKAASIFLS